MRIEVEPTRLSGDDQAEAKKLGEQYGASMIIWGADTGVRLTVNFLNLKEPDYKAVVKISETERTQLANPKAYARFITNDLPGQLIFLALYAVDSSYYIREDDLQAMQVIEKAVAALPPQMTPPQGAAEAYYRLGWLYENRSQQDQAIVNYNKAIELDAKYASAYNNRGIAYQDQGDYQRAIADYNKAIELNYDPLAWPYNNRGIVYHKQGDYERAIADYTKAIELDPQATNAWNDLCWTGSLTGIVTEVMDACERAVKLAPDDGLIHDSRGLARALTGDYQGAIEDFKFFVEWSKQNDQYEQYGRKREAWIIELEADRNPFDKATLEALRKE